jgi:hypothetical protein
VLGAYRLTGRNVQDNDKLEIMAGFYRRLINEDDRLMTLGMTGMAWHFSENAGEYTFGHGGYYSPKTYRSLALPITYGWRTQRTSVLLRASVSVAWSESRRAPFYPTDPELQARAEALQSTTFVEPFYSGGLRRAQLRPLGGGDRRAPARAQRLHRRAPGARALDQLHAHRFLLYVRFTADKSAARPGGVAARAHASRIPVLTMRAHRLASLLASLAAALATSGGAHALDHYDPSPR